MIIQIFVVKMVKCESIMLSIGEILEIIRRESIRWLELQFMDLVGIIHAVTVPSRELSIEVFKTGFSKLDGSSIVGFEDISLSDLNLVPDPATFSILPWTIDGDKISRFICKVYGVLASSRLERDPRYIAEKMRSYLDSNGLKAYIGPEIEFFLFTKVEVNFKNPSSGIGYYLESPEAPWACNGYPINYKSGYFIPKPLDKVYDYRIVLSRILEEYFNIPVEAHHHEAAASSQVEVNIRYSELPKACDDVLTLRYAARRIGEQFNFYVTFMPKPVYGDNGSGMHTHVSIWRGNENLFYDPNDEYAELSQYARYFIGGLIEHGRSLSALASPTVNSYKRLVPCYEAPIYLVWSKANRSAAIRVPVYKKGDYMKRIEYRPPDPLANPYLLFPAMILAGLDGVKKKIDPGDPIDKNIYHMSDEERAKYNIKTLPRDLYEALDELESDNEYLKPIFSSSLIEEYIEIKKREIREVTQYISPSEIYHYFSW